MRTVLIRMAAVCGIVCLLVLSTTQCSKPETPPADASTPQADASVKKDTIEGWMNFSTYQQTGSITLSNGGVIDLNTFKVSGLTLNIALSRGNGDTMLINRQGSVTIQSVQPWPGKTGTPPGGSSTGVTEQPTKVSVLGGGPGDPAPKP